MSLARGSQRTQGMENLSHRKLKKHNRESKNGDRGLSKVKEHTVASGGVRGALPSMAPESLRGKCHLVTNEIRDRGLSKVKEHTVVSGYVRGALPSMAPEPFRGKSHLVTDKSSDVSTKNKGLDKMDNSRSGPGKRILKRPAHQHIHKAHSSLRLRDEDSPVRETAKAFSQNSKFLGGGSKKRNRNEDLEVNSPRTDMHINDPQSEEHIDSTTNGTTVMQKETTAFREEHIGSTSNVATVTRKETRALSATKRNRLNNRKLVFEVDDCAGRIVGEDSQTFITKGGCLVRESEKFDGTT